MKSACGSSGPRSTTIGVPNFSFAGIVTGFLTAARAEQEKIQHDTRRLRLFSGTSNPGLSREIAAYLGVPDLSLIHI